MIRTSNRHPRILGLLTSVLTGLLGSPAWAESVAFRNDCRLPVVVQAATVERGLLKREQCLLRPGELTGRMPLDAEKIVTVLCGRTGKLLFRDVLRTSKTSQNYSILPDPRAPNRVRMLLYRPVPPPAPRARR